MNLTKWVSRALVVTAILNLGSGIASIADPALHAKLLLGPDFVLDGLLLRYHVMLWSFIAALGVGYAVASRSPQKQTGVILAGGIGKLCAAGAWIEMLAHGYGTPLMLAGIAFDGSVGLLFLYYTLRNADVLA